MQAGFNVMLKLNGQFVETIYVNENMMFCELVFNYCRNHNLENPTFYYQSKSIKPDSCRTLRELEIRNMSLIEVKTNSLNNNMSQKRNSNMEKSNENQKNALNEYKEKINELEIKLKEEKKKNEFLEKQINNLEKRLRIEKKKNDELKRSKESNIIFNLNEFNKIILDKEKK